MKILKKPQALDDILNYALYLEDEASEDIAGRFVNAVDRTIASISANPQIGRGMDFKASGAEAVRAWNVEGFEDWTVYYRSDDSRIEIIRVLHGAMDRSQWGRKTDWR